MLGAESGKDHNITCYAKGYFLTAGKHQNGRKKELSFLGTRTVKIGDKKRQKVGAKEPKTEGKQATFYEIF